MRLRLKPGLRRVWRDPGTLQIGLSRRCGTVITGLTLQDIPLLEALRHGVDATAPPGLTAYGDPERGRALVRVLAQAGVLAAAGPSTPEPGRLGQAAARLAPDAAVWAAVHPRSGDGWAVLATRAAQVVLVHGAGRLGSTLCATLAAAGVGTVLVRDAGRVTAADLAPAGAGLPDLGRTRQSVGQDIVRRAGGHSQLRSHSAGRSAPTGPRPTSPATDLGSGVAARAAVPPRGRASTGAYPDPVAPAPRRSATAAEAPRGSTTPAEPPPHPTNSATPPSRPPNPADARFPSINSARTRPQPTAPAQALPDSASSAWPPPPSEPAELHRQSAPQPQPAKREYQRSRQQPSPSRRPVPAHQADGTLDSELARADLVVLVSHGIADATRADYLMSADVPHLAVVVGEDGVVVGPLVRPGRSPCLRCLDLYRRDRDPDWPRVLSQLQEQPGSEPEETASAGLAAGLAALQVLAELDGMGVPAALGATLEVELPDGLIARRPWRVHPACGCAWPAPSAGPPEWGDG